MQLLSSLLLLVLPATVRSAALPRAELDTFTLSTPSPAPAPLPSLGTISWLGTGVQTIGGPLGWFSAAAPHTPLKAFIQYNAKSGIAFDSTKTSRTIFLRAEDVNGLSQVELGAPDFEPDLTKVRATNFTIAATASTPGESHYWLGYAGENFDVWSACRATEDADGWQLYFGTVEPGTAAEGCTENFSLEVTYTGGNPPCC